MPRRKTIEDCHKLAKSKGGKFLSEKYINSKQKYLWKCSDGHVWPTSYDTISGGSWCRKCYNIKVSKRNKKHNIEECKKIAEERNGKCLSDEYVNTGNKLIWKCNICNTEWKSKLGDILTRNSWCPNCGQIKRQNSIRKINIEKCKQIAKERGGECLSIEYKNSKQKLKWKCGSCETIWVATFLNIFYNKSWCPQCCLWKSQKKLYKLIEKIFLDYKINIKNKFINYKGFDWLINEESGRRMEIDLFFETEGFNIGIEYDGQMHFFAVDFFGGEEQLKKRKRLDKIKNKLIKEHKEDIDFFIRHSYKNEINYNNVLTRLIKEGVPLNLEVL